MEPLSDRERPRGAGNPALQRLAVLATVIASVIAIVVKVVPA